MSNIWGVIVSFAAAFCWGILYAQVQSLTVEFPPFALLSVAYLAGALVLTPIAISQGSEITNKIRSDPGDFFFCLLALLAAEGLIFFSISLLGGTEASLIEVRKQIEYIRLPIQRTFKTNSLYL